MNKTRTRTGSKRSRLAALLLLAALVALFLPPVVATRAQNYRFQVPELVMNVFVQPDASARIVYDITFENQPGADPIDIVDIGLPHDNYDISNMSAALNGTPLPTIRDSEFVDPGVEIPLGAQQIAPGQRGTLHFECTMPDMVYQDTTDDELASFRITPTWFDKDLVSGSSDIQVNIHIPPDIAPDEVLHQGTPFTNKIVEEGRVVAQWRWSDGTATKAYNVAVSFPKRSMDRVVEMSAFTLLMNWLKESIVARVILYGTAIVMSLVFFFRVTGGTGLGVLIVAGWCCIQANEPLLMILLIIVLLVLFPFTEFLIRHRSKKYLPPIVQVEGGGIKRGLTAPEAAVLLELPRSKVLMLVIFGMLKKGMLEQTSADPLTVTIAEAFRGLSREQRRAAAHQKGVVIHTYEHGFLDEIAADPARPLSKLDFKKPLEALVKHVVKRVTNFDLSDTKDYYRAIVERAVSEAQSIGDIEQREQKLDRDMEWIMMDKDYGTVFDHGTYRYRPVWMRRPVFIGGGGGSIGGGGGGSSSGGGSTSFGDVAASFAGWTENTMGGLADTVAPDSSGGLIDLSSLDKSSGGGGSGSGCACACAGCACACACAGGGR